ncbi:MAG: PRC-barrel domain-containing protein [Thermoanaerobaculia bacterium]
MECRKTLTAIAIAAALALPSTVAAQMPHASARTVEANLATLMDGAARSLTRAATELRAGHRRSATASIDAANRITHVGTEASVGPVRDAFFRAKETIHRGRQALQNGDAGRAADLFDQAARQLALETRPTGSTPVSREHLWDQFIGARLLNARGETIGEIVAFERSGGQVTSIRFDAGGWHDVGGFMDFGGTPVSLPYDRFVFGGPKVIGETLVALAEDVTVKELTR